MKLSDIKLSKVEVQELIFSGKIRDFVLVDTKQIRAGSLSDERDVTEYYLSDTDGNIFMFDTDYDDYPNVWELSYFKPKIDLTEVIKPLTIEEKLALLEKAIIVIDHFCCDHGDEGNEEVDFIYRIAHGANYTAECFHVHEDWRKKLDEMWEIYGDKE